MTPADTPPQEEHCASVAAVLPMVNCVVCNAKLPTTEIRQHQLNCHSQNQGSQHKDNASTSQPISNEKLAHLKEIFPEKENEELLSHLTQANWDCEEAVHSLIEKEDILLIEDNSSLSDWEDCFNSDPINAIGTPDPSKMFRQYKEKEQLLHRQETFMLNRMQTEDEIKTDLVRLYKSASKNLKAVPKIFFSGEEGVGSGPTREFFAITMHLVEEGVNCLGKVALFLEGEPNHKIPVHNPPWRQTGMYKCIGRMIAHSLLHDGQGLFGVSPAVTHYWSVADIANNPPPCEYADIPDFELRELIQQLDEGEMTEDHMDRLLPYMLESGLDMALTVHNRPVAIQGLFLYNIIEKRKAELDDIAKGMGELSLLKFLKNNRCVSGIFSPRSEEAIILPTQLKNKIEFEDEVNSEDSAKTKEFFLQYIDSLGAENGETDLKQLCRFWMGNTHLAVGEKPLKAKIEKGCGPLPIAETCFASIILPNQPTYEAFRDGMDVALKMGSKGFGFL